MVKGQRVRVGAGGCRIGGSELRDVRRRGARAVDWHGSWGIVRCSAQRKCREEVVCSRSFRIWPKVGDYRGGVWGVAPGIRGSVPVENFDFRILTGTEEGGSQIRDLGSQRVKLGLRSWNLVSVGLRGFP